MNNKERKALAYYASSAKENAEEMAKESNFKDHFYPCVAGVMEVYLRTISEALLNNECPEWIVLRYDTAMADLKLKLKK